METKRVVDSWSRRKWNWCSKLAQKHGFDVFVSDFGGIADRYKTALQEFKISFEENQHTA
jgi:UDP-N-acetylmuramoylalanine--D-glutamate ligase